MYISLPKIGLLYLQRDLSKMKEDLIKIKVINPRALGKLNGVEVYLTKGLEKKLKKRKTREGNFLDLLKTGRAL